MAVMKLKKIFPTLPFFAFLALSAQMPPMDFSSNQPISVQNSILAKVNATTISVMDVKKQMDLMFHQHYSHLSESNQARYQFYEASWRRVLMDLIDNELILSDAADKEIKLTDGEVREEMENRFGPNVLTTLDQIGLSYDDAWKMLKNELLVRRMTWWFIHSRAIQSVTPGDIKKAYQRYLAEHPPYQEFQYQVLSIREDANGDSIEALGRFLQGKPGQSPEELSQELLQLAPSIQISSTYTLSDQEISAAHKQALSSLEEKTYSLPVTQTSRNSRQPISRIFYLIAKTDHPAPSFQELSPNLRNELTQKAVAQESQQYVSKLRKRYGFDQAYLEERCPQDFHPFSIQ